jgi:hypothetical protein
MKNSFAYLESIGKSKVWAAYAENFANEEILEEGFNPNSGYVYIALENGVTIGSCVGHDVEFIIYDNETEKELFIESFVELLNHIEK